MIAPEASAAFVAAMEDVLEVYQRPHDSQRPLVCFVERFEWHSHGAFAVKCLVIFGCPFISMAERSTISV